MGDYIMPPRGYETMLQAITEANVHFIDGRDKDFLFTKLLQHSVDLTGSRFGFVGELVGPPSSPSSALHIISFNTDATPHTTTFSTLELSMQHLADAITSRSPYITNSVRAEDLPPTFPSIQSFLGIPLFHHEDIVGMLGLADKPDGYHSSMATFLHPFSTTCGSLMVGYRKQAEQKSMLHMLENARREAEESALAKAHFLSNMSHEIRTPLNGIIGLTSLVLDSPLTFDQRDMVETVQSSGDLLLSVVNDILDLAKFEAGKLDLHEVHFDIRACVEACIDVVSIAAERRGIEVVSDVAEEVPATMLGDFDRVRQILTNLVGNAVKFTERGEVVVGVRLESSQIMTMQRSFSGGHLQMPIQPTIEEGEQGGVNDSKVVHFWIRDTGIGIPRDKKDLLFKMYTQIDPYRTNGTGLGLAICKRLVEAMSGKIWATSEQNVGSCFHFTIPAVTSTGKAAYYPSLKGKSLTIFSHLESHARVLEDFAHQHAMTSTAHVLETGLLSLPLLQSLHTSSAVIIDVVHADRIVAQLERYFREGRASPQTPSYSVSPPTAGPSLTTGFATSLPAFSSLALSKATARTLQMAPVTLLMSEQPTPDTPPPSSLPAPFGLIPPPVATSTSSSLTISTATSIPRTAPSSTPTTTTSIPSTTTTTTTISSAAITTTATTPSSTSTISSTRRGSLRSSSAPKQMPPERVPESTPTPTTQHPQTRPSAPTSASPALTLAPASVTPSKLKQPSAQGSTSPRVQGTTSPRIQGTTSPRIQGSTSPRTQGSTSPRAPSHPSKPTQDPASPTRRMRTSSMPPKATMSTSMSSTSPIKGKLTSPTFMNPPELSLNPKSRDAQAVKPSPTKPILQAKPPAASMTRRGSLRSSSAPKPMPPERVPESPQSASPPKKGMVQSKSTYTIAYLNATQLSSPSSDAPPRESTTSPLLKRTPIGPLKVAPLSPKITTSTIPTAAQKQNPQGATQIPSLPSSIPSPRPTNTSNLPTINQRQGTSPTLGSAGSNVLSSASTTNYPNLRVNVNTASSNSNSNSTPSTPLQSPLGIANLQTSTSSSSSISSFNSGSTSARSSSPALTPSSNPSTPSSSPIIPCPILIFVPMSSPPPRTTCANLFFLPKPIKFSRLSRKLEVIFENPLSPATPSRPGRPIRQGSVSRFTAGEDFVMDSSMALAHPLTIMVGEDNLVGQVVTQRMLSKLGYTAEFYGSGDALLENLENRVFDVILLDLRMPGYDGFECARRICAALPIGHRPHIAAVTANILQSDRDMAAAVGFNDYITKPFLLPDLARVLARCKKLDLVHTFPFRSVTPPSPPPPLSHSG